MSKTTGRRSIWEQQRVGEVAGEQEESLSWGSETEPRPQMLEAVPVIEQLRVAKKKHRDRSWEQNNRTFLLRSVPPGLHEAIKQIAEELQVRTSDVARAFLEYGLLCHQRGELQIVPVLSNQRLTLFPAGAGWGKSRPGWYEKVCDPRSLVVRARKSKIAKDKTPKAWKQQFAYRGIPTEIQAAIRTIHRQCQVPLGEVATMLLGHSLQAYYDGKLELCPQPRQAPGLGFTGEA